MEELIDLIATDGQASDISDSIKQILYAKSAEKINSTRPYVASAMFNSESPNEDYSEDQE
jgi:hypothetical protein